MPTATTTSPRKAKPRAKAARKPASAKTATARRSTSRAAKSATYAKAASSNGAGGRSQTTPLDGVGDYAERAVLIPVGAALIARERVVSTVSDTFSSYSTGPKAQAQLRRFERRGATARKRLEREVRKARVRVERELRQRRRVVENTVSDLEDRRDAFAKNVPDIVDRVPELVDRVQERILSLV